MRRPRRAAAIAFAVILFIAVSAELARWLSLENLERSHILSVLSAEARGDPAAMLAQLHGCVGRCRATVIADARTLARPGHVLILADQSATAYAFTSTAGYTRIAWEAGSRLPVVQCVKVSRTGNALSGLTVRLLAVSAQIPGTADCPR